MKNCRGQALVETLFTIILLTTILFAGIQVCIMVTNDLISNEAAFAISRVAVVCPTREDVKKNTQTAALFLFFRHTSLSNFTFVPYDIPVEAKSLGKIHRTDVEAYSTQVKYASNVMFARFVSGDTLFSIGNIHLVKGTSRARMVKSPHPEFYGKAFKDAKNFNQ